MDFSDALRLVKGGGVVARQVWLSHGMTLGVMAPPAESNIMPFLAIRAPEGKLIAWTPGNQELFSDDWVQVQEEGVGHG